MLTHDNYYTKDNNYLTNSKISDYLLDPNYFYRKHITHEIEPDEPTSSMLIGKAVDAWLTMGKPVFFSQFERKVLKKNDADAYEAQQFTDKTVLSETEYDKVVAICEEVERHDAYLSLIGHQKQVILRYDRPCGNKHFSGIAGMVDFLEVKRTCATITDLKTSVDIDSRSYHYKCLDYGYYRQLGMYYGLLKLSNPKIKKVTCRHLVVENGGIHRVKCFVFDAKLVNHYWIEQKKLIEKIFNQDNFDPKNVSWKRAETVKL